MEKVYNNFMNINFFVIFNEKKNSVKKLIKIK